MLIAPSILSADFSKLGQEIADITHAGADWIHLDVMDGRFVPNLTFGAPVIKAVRGHTKLPFDVHLMIEDPHRYIGDFCDAGADIISFHVEAERDIAGTIAAIKQRGVRAALAVKPGTAMESVFPYLDEISMVLVMTVEPGFGGQEYQPGMMQKVQAVKARAPRMQVQIDGGVNVETIRPSAAAGVDVCVAGTSVFGAQDRKARIAELKQAACEAKQQQVGQTPLP